MDILDFAGVSQIEISVALEPQTEKVWIVWLKKAMPLARVTP